MAEFKNRKELKPWLEEQPRAVSIVIAARASLRVLPLLAAEFHTNKHRLDAVARATALPIFCATAVTWVAGRYPAHVTELAAAANAVVNMGSEANVAGDVLQAAFNATGTFNEFDFAALGAHTVAAANAAAEYAAQFAATDTTVAALYSSVSADATRIENGTAPEKLAGEALWANKTPGWAKQNWTDLRRRVLELDPGWRVWTEWYEARLAGRPTYPRATAEQNEQLEVTRAMIDKDIWEKVAIALTKINEEIWKQGPAAVNAEIRRLEEEILGTGWDTDAEDPAQLSSSAGVIDFTMQPHPLDGALLKVERAKHHINELEAQATQFLREHRGLIVQDVPETGKRGLFFKADEPIPDSFGLLIGDPIHNLRAALDHVIWAVVSPRNPPKPKQVQFPFAESEQELVGSIKRRQIKLAGPDVESIIRGLRPYPGGNDDLVGLHELDITDKHKVIAVVATVLGVDQLALPMFDPTAPRVILSGFNFIGAENKFLFVWTPMQLPPGTAAKAVVPPHGPETKATFDIFFGESQPFARKTVIPTLVRLTKKVTNAVERFRPIFAP